MSAQAIEFVLQRWRTKLPANISLAYFDGFVERLRPQLEEIIGGWLKRRAAKKAQAEPESQTVKARTVRNIKAMQIVAARRPEDMSADERRALLGYTGWGGLSIEGVMDQFPPTLIPSEFALVHEYYTPTVVAEAIADLVCPYLPELAGHDGVVRALEPNVGIGRLVRAMGPPRCIPDEKVKEIRWTTVELSEVSAKMFAAIRPDAELFEMSTERWMSEHAPRYQGQVGLILANPPYGQRGEYALQDKHPNYQGEKAAYAYVMRRALDLLVPTGMAVFAIPAGFLDGSSNRKLRERVLLRHHLVVAFRLPSELASGREMFPGAGNVVDVLVWRCRGGELQEPDPADTFILDGEYFKEFPGHILGVEHDKLDAAARAAAAKAKANGQKPRRLRYRVVGDFSGFPAFVPREVCSSCSIRNAPALEVMLVDSGIRDVEGVDATVSDELHAAIELGRRVDTFLALVAAENPRAVNLWPELHQALEDFRNTPALKLSSDVPSAGATGNPWKWTELRELARRKQLAQRLLTAYQKGGQLIPALASPPDIRPKFTAAADDVLAQAEHLYRTARRLDVDTLEAFHRAQGGQLTRDAMLDQLLAGEWNLDGPNWDDLLPSRAYVMGTLWPRYDRAAQQGAAGSEQAVKQLRRLDGVMNFATFEDIYDVSPRQGWVPLPLVSQWVGEKLNGRYGVVELDRVGGTVQIAGAASDDGLAEYRKLGASTAVTPETLWCIGWMNHDFTLFKPDLGKEEMAALKLEDATANGTTVAEADAARKGEEAKPKAEDDDDDEELGYLRLLLGRHWDRDFLAWVKENDERRDAVREGYNRAFRGVVVPTYDGDMLEIARWNPGGPFPKPHQAAGARRVLDLRGGLIAFDVGVGKTYAAIAVIAAARQDGWSRRPVVLVPSSLVWKWADDIQCVLPDYRIAVIGSRRKVISRGKRKGFATSDTDTPQQRATKWTEFQAGLYDVVILSYDALGRTRMNEDALLDYLDTIEGIKRQIKMRQRNAGKREKSGKMSERDRAILKHGARAFVEETLELPKNHLYDPGIAWDDIGIDLLVVDEAANFKNSYMPESREYGTPKFMGGGAGEGAKRAWQLNFRCAAVRRKNGGGGIVLLSATPAKNSPLEFYNLIQLIDPYAFSKKGLMDPEQFIDRFLQINTRQVVDMQLNPKMSSCVDGFKNLDDLRMVIKTYGEFRSGAEVGLKMPEPRSEQVRVAMNEAQDTLYRAYRIKLARALELAGRFPGQTSNKILGLMQRMAMVSLHPSLDGGMEYDAALNIDPDDYSAPKLEECAKRIAASPGCGHIIFCDPTAVQLWMREILVRHKVPRERIAILNAVETESADRVRIAREFNGVSTAPQLPGACSAGAKIRVTPKFDVVIANVVAYEGIDLQVRTCTIHHLDLPWTPADLEQRNGRGVRQGNELPVVNIYYYLTDNSMDWYRYQLIQGKRAWLGDVLDSQKRETSNPGAQDEMTTDDILLANAGPEERAQLEAAIKARRAGIVQQAQEKIAKEAAILATQANARFRDARETGDPVQATRLRAEGEQRLKDVRRADPAAWPWANWIDRVRDQNVLIASPSAPPVFDGLRVRWRGEQYCEFGRVENSTIGRRWHGNPYWDVLTEQQVHEMNLQPADLEAGVTWPDEPDLGPALDAHVDGRVGETGQPGAGFEALEWTGAGDVWLDTWWPRVSTAVRAGLAKTEQTYPVEVDGVLMLAEGEALRAAELLAPSLAGWRRFLELAPQSELTITELRVVAASWWRRKAPRGFLGSRGSEAPSSTSAGQEEASPYPRPASKNSPVVGDPHGIKGEESSPPVPAAGVLSPDAETRLKALETTHSPAQLRKAKDRELAATLPPDEISVLRKAVEWLNDHSLVEVAHMLQSADVIDDALLDRMWEALDIAVPVTTVNDDGQKATVDKRALTWSKVEAGSIILVREPVPGHRYGLRRVRVLSSNCDDVTCEIIALRGKVAGAEAYLLNARQDTFIEQLHRHLGKLETLIATPEMEPASPPEASHYPPGLSFS